MVADTFVQLPLLHGSRTCFREPVVKQLRNTTRHKPKLTTHHRRSSASRQMALIDPLLKTTWSPIWVHPLLWGLDHLNLFGISVQHISPQPHSQKQTTISSHSSDGRLRGGFIGSRDLKYVLQDIQLLEIYLAAFLVRTINTFQKSLRPKPFRYFSDE